MVAQDRASNGSRSTALDPSERAQSGLIREIANLKENTDIRLDAMDEAIRLTQQYPTLLDKAIDGFQKQMDMALHALEKLHEEKFKGVADRFSERDIRNKQAADDTKMSMGKTEQGFTKQIDALSVNVAQNNGALDSKITDIKDRLTTIEGQKKGGENLWGYIVGAGGLLLAAWALFHSGVAAQ